MKSNIVDPGGLCNAGLLFATALACFASPKAARAEPLYSRGDWLLGISAAKVFTGEKLDSISAGGLAIPGAGIDITNDTTGSVSKVVEILRWRPPSGLICA